MFKDLKIGVKDTIEGIMEVAQLIMMIVGFKEIKEAQPGEERKEAVRQHLPHLFGFGKADERIYSGLLVGLKMEKLPSLTSLMSAMTEKEREQFRLIVTGIKAQMRKEDEKNRENIEFTEGDIRVKFLIEIVGLVDKLGAQQVVEMLRTHQIIGINPSSKKLKGFAAKFLGLTDIEDLADPEKVTDAINRNLRPKLQVKLCEIDKPTSKSEAFVGRLFNI